MSGLHRFVYRVDHTPHKPLACMNCGLTNLEENIAIAKVGPKKTGPVENKPNVYCPDCETLMIIVNYQPIQLQLKPSPGYTITLKPAEK